MSSFKHNVDTTLGLIDIFKGEFFRAERSEIGEILGDFFLYIGRNLIKIGSDDGRKARDHAFANVEIAKSRISKIDFERSFRAPGENARNGFRMREKENAKKRVQNERGGGGEKTDPK